MEQIDDPDVVKSKIDQLLNDLDESLTLLNLSLAKATESLTGISNLMCDEHYDFIDLICNTFADRKLCEKLHSVYPKNEIINNEIVKLIQKIVKNFSERPNAFPEAVVSSEIFKSLVDVFLHVDSSGDIDDPKTKAFLFRSVFMINNIARNHCQQIKHKRKEIKNTLKKYMKSNCDDKLGVNSILALSYLLDDTEVDQLDEGVGAINKVIEHIQSIIDNDKRSGGFSLEELLHGLMNLSRNDKMKIKIEEGGGIHLLIKIIRTKNEVKLVLGIIENLCRDDRIKQKLKDDYKIKEVLKPFAEIGPPEIKEICDRLKIQFDLSEIQDKNRSNNSLSYMTAVLL